MALNLNKLSSTADFKNRTLTTEDIEQLVQYKKLLGIAFTNCPITDDDILIISKLPKLVNVLLENTNITDKSLEYLANIPNLKYLFITKANLNGEGFKYFENSKKLDCIWVCSTKLNDENLKIISKIPNLSTLRIDDTLVTFGGLINIASNPKIRVVANDIFTKEQIEIFEQEQIRQTKKKHDIDENEINIAKETLTNFFNAITDWEKYAAKVGFTDELGVKCKEIFKIFCIEKPRRGYRPDNLSFSCEPNYTYGTEIFFDSEQISKNKIILYTKNHIDFKYRYILLKKDNQWKIDERQWHSGGWKKNGL